MSADVGVLDMVDLSTIVNVPLPCEHSQHRAAADRHKGDSEWIQYNAGCLCPNIASLFVCPKWRDWVRDLARKDGKLYCMRCKISYPAALTTFERI
ncbi:hypothetical protein [Paeniglutamicibacter terrestris]|uniref:DUF3039 domain-containing protein n=1 Tax=Paeniglutamicibacter terrestris TaxID=2723403 RepID=A0ABX1G696_9MICC|nr:hypothetical protein [Paeniglutamicibacter terrestris]NKG21086.1 hypothetical protein [Paeniglutamicibacter terrestris]